MKRNRWTSAIYFDWSFSVASIVLSKSNISALKKAIYFTYPEFKSSHLSEAIAFALNRKTYAALLADINKYTNDPPIELLDDSKFFSRMKALGYVYDDGFSFEIYQPEVISTLPDSAYQIKYSELRGKAWRNLMVIAINEGIKQNLFSIRPGDNRWGGAHSDESFSRGLGAVFSFTFLNGWIGRGFVHDAGFGELSIHAAINPKGDSVKAYNAGFSAGDAFATGWLERQRGAWLQSSKSLNCKRNIIRELAEMDVKPLGYGDKGRVIL